MRRARFALAALALSAGMALWSGIAGAALPKAVDVYSSWDVDQAPVSVRLDAMPQRTSDYDVVLRGKNKPVRVTLTGVRLVDFLNAAAVNLENVQFVKIRFGTTDDSAMALMPLNQSSDRPPLMLSAGTRPGLGPFATPAIVPGQVDITRPILERDFVPFSASGQRLSMIPAKPGARILAVNLVRKKTRSGQFKFKSVVLNGTKGAARSYQWYGHDAKGRTLALGHRPTLTTTDATKGTAQHYVTVVVTERLSGSTGVGAASYLSKKRRK